MASWVIRRLDDGTVLFETYNPAIVAHINRDRYEAVPILAYLAEVNQQAKDPPPPPSGKR